MSPDELKKKIAEIKAKHSPKGESFQDVIDRVKTKYGFMPDATKDLKKNDIPNMAEPQGTLVGNPGTNPIVDPMQKGDVVDLGEAAFKKKHPNVGTYHSGGHSREAAHAKAQELRAQGHHGTVWHMSGPRTGPKSQYAVATAKPIQEPKISKSLSVLHKAKMDDDMSVGTKRIARDERRASAKDPLQSQVTAKPGVSKQGAAVRANKPEAAKQQALNTMQNLKKDDSEEPVTTPSELVQSAKGATKEKPKLLKTYKGHKKWTTSGGPMKVLLGTSESHQKIQAHHHHMEEKGSIGQIRDQLKDPTSKISRSLVDAMEKGHDTMVVHQPMRKSAPVKKMAKCMSFLKKVKKSDTMPPSDDQPDAPAPVSGGY